MPGSNGGTTAPLNLLLIPVTDNTHIINLNGLMFTFDPTNFNDPGEPSSYSWKVEEVAAGRTPSCTRQILMYRDLGVATITGTLSGYDQNAQATVSNSETFSIGTVAATQKLCTTVRGLSLTAQNLQYSIVRAANAGPVSIVKLRLEGRVEMTAYA
jgi:GTPase